MRLNILYAPALPNQATIFFTGRWQVYGRFV